MDSVRLPIATEYSVTAIMHDNGDQPSGYLTWEMFDAEVDRAFGQRWYHQPSLDPSTTPSEHVKRHAV